MATKILVVDDDLNICEMLRLYLKKEGYDVANASDGEEGVERFKEYDPDLVLLDIMLPKRDGWSVCREIREMSDKPGNHDYRKGRGLRQSVRLRAGR